MPVQMVLAQVQYRRDRRLKGIELVKVKAGSNSHETVAADLSAPYGLAIRGNSAYVTTGSLAPDNGRVIKIDL